MLCVALVFTGLPVNSFAADISVDNFTDLPNDWSRDGLIKAVENGLLSGYNNKIMPNDYLTRAQMAAILNKAFGAKTMASLEMFKDVQTGKWYYKDMAIAYKMGTFSGSGAYMMPENFITREEVFSVIAKALNLGEGNSRLLMVFKDYEDSSAWSKGFMASMFEMGYIKGANATLLPKKNITRAEFAALMNNLFKHYIRVPGTYTGAFNGTVMVTSADVILKDVEINGNLIIGDGVGDGEVTLDNVTYTGRLIVRGSAIVVEADIDDEDVALGPGGIPGPPAGGTPGGGTPGGPGGGVVTPNTSLYGFVLKKGTTEVLVDDLRFRDNDKVNFQMVSNVFNLGNDDFLAAIDTQSDFIERALRLTSDRSGEAYALSLANRVVNYVTDGGTDLKVLDDGQPYIIFQEIVAEGNADLENVDLMVDALLAESLMDIVTDLEKLYNKSDDYVPADFLISFYNGTTLAPQNQMLISEIREKFDTNYNAYTLDSVVNKKIFSIKFGDETVEIIVRVYED